MLVVKCARPVSWYWQGLILFALCLALASISFCAWRHAYPWWLGLLLALWLIYYTYQGLALLCWRYKPRAIIALHLYSATKIEILCRNGERHLGELCPGGLVLASITLLLVRVTSPQFKARVLLEAQRMPQKDYRAVARMVRERA